LSRREAKSRPSTDFSSRRRSSSDTTGTGFSGTTGGRILAIGLSVSSSSSTSQAKNCCNARKRLEAVAGERVSVSRTM